MANNVVEIILKTIKQGDGEKQVSGALGGLNTGLINFSMGMTAVKQAYQVLSAVAQALVGDTLDYATQIRDLTRETGLSADEASRLTQVADDLQISFGTLETAAKNAARQGITLTTDALAAMSDEYLTLEPGAERTRYALEMFGKQAGPEMQKFLEKGSGAIREMSASIDDSMILTEGQVAAALKLEQQWDGLEDAAQGVGYAIGNWVVPKLATAAEAALTLLTSTQQLDAMFQQHEGVMRTSATSWEEYAAEIIRSGAESGQFTGAQVRMARAFADGTLVLSEHKDRVNELVVAVGGASEAAYNNAEANGMLDRTQEMVRDGAGEMAVAMTELAPTISDITSMFGALTKELIFNKAAADLDGNAALALAGAMGLIEPETKAALDMISVLTDKYDENEDGAISAEEASKGYTASISGMAEAALVAGDRDPYETMMSNSDAAWEAVNKVKTEIENIPANKLVNLTIDVTYNGEMPDQSWMDDLDNGGPPEPEGAVDGMLADGGTAWKGLGYWVGEEGPEFIRPQSTSMVYTNGEWPRAGGVVVNLYGPVTVREDTDIEKIAARLAELVRRRN